MIKTKVSELIGETPLLELPLRDCSWKLLLKLEKFNPGMSMKDRMARSMIEAAVREGRLQPGGVIVESSSGNTATGLALLAAEMGFRFIAVMDHHAAAEKVMAVKAYGGEVHIVKGDYADDEVATVERELTAARLASEIEGACFMDQSNNLANPGGYSGTLAHELIRDTDGGIDALVACVGTGGSITGVASELKRYRSDIRIFGVEPVGSVVFRKEGGPYYQSGTGVPPGDAIGAAFRRELVDYGYQVTDAEAFETCRYLARQRGLLIGGSAGGAVYQSVKIAQNLSGSGTMVCIVCDGGEKYLPTIFNDEWMSERGLFEPRVHQELNRWLTPAFPGRVNKTRAEADARAASLCL
ncbi:cysteine synthase family protein [Hahella aquimaris]|uniref:PLP-dependent cysteine synthase family protein n=1 Tax=Hahella sp. HNIBRBA332 TaxID=3015983 RepID=UPI00273CB8FA|nr:cysteine synthase family protein [Hahella sp. HNIBRBA332]WLQ16053.1 cysteine synthase family protein [Hahella sp. HNIBRBA332]